MTGGHLASLALQENVLKPGSQSYNSPLTRSSGGGTVNLPPPGPRSPGPPARPGDCLTAGMSTTLLPSTVRFPTAGGEDTHVKLDRALANMRDAGPQEPFVGHYLLLKEQVQGGQALVVFARGRDGGFFQYAIKCAPFVLPCELPHLSGHSASSAPPSGPSPPPLCAALQCTHDFLVPDHRSGSGRNANMAHAERRVQVLPHGGGL